MQFSTEIQESKIWRSKIVQKEDQVHITKEKKIN